MRRSESFMFGAVALLLIAYGLQVADVWPILIAHLTIISWAALALVHLGAILTVASIYMKTRKAHSFQQLEILSLTAMMLITWSVDFGLIAKIGFALI